jgi:hypothetical protein
MANRRFIDFPIASTVGDNDIVLIWQDGLNKQTTKGTLIQGAPTSLEGLTDVDIAGLINGQILQYNSVTGKWENVDRADLNLSELGDVSIVSPSNGQVLIYNSTTSKWENSSAGFVPYTGAVTTVDLGLQGLRAGYIRFDTSVVSVPEEQGIMYWDADNETVDVILNGTIMQIGQDLFYPVKNQTGSTIAKGTAVRFAGTVGASGRLLIAPFIADNSVASSRFMGVTSEAILNGADGKVMWFGRIRGINTNAFNEGDILYASTTTAGGFQTAIPVAPNNIVQVAAVVTKSTNNGAIFVRPTLGSNINKDEGVKIVSVANLDLLQYQSGTGLWENKTIDAAGIVTKATNQTITGIKTFTQDIVVNGVEIGRGAGNVTSNTLVGDGSLNANTTGNSNTALGQAALPLNTTGSSNSAVGRGALEKNTTAIWNCGFGTFALFGNTTGSENIAIGNGAGGFIANGITENSITNNSIFLGGSTKALANNQTNQIVIGHNAIGNGSNTVTIGNSSITDNYFTGNIRGGAFIRTGGTSAQFLKADGSVDSTSYGTGSVTSVAALTLGTSGTDLSSTVANGTTTPVITLNVPTASASNRGALSAADWTTFNNKQNALTNPVTGTGTAGQVAYWSSGSAITGESNLFWDFTNDRLGIGTPSPSSALHVYNSSQGVARFESTQGEVNIALNNSTASGNLIGTIGANFYFYSGGSDRMRIFNDGNVSISNSPSNAGFKLDVNGTGRFSGNLTISNSGTTPAYFGATSSQGFLNLYSGTSSAYNNGASITLVSSDRSGALTRGEVYIEAGNASNNTANGFIQMLTGNSPRMTITSGGNVLIGTTTNGASRLRIVGLPTSAAGLSSGDVYNLSGVLMIA